MILRKIKLNNIRSYENQEVSFTEGSTLLSGDIGSGKTSILLGIEFALFGLQPGQRGYSLLRNGEQTGGVVIEFEVDGKEIIIERTLKLGKTVSQDYCAITIDGEKIETSVGELKNKVLELLSYPKEFSKKQNILYKFTVYTPQEEMKQIILQDSETRINTLRHVFGIDKYKKVLENVVIITAKLREEKRIKQGVTLNLEQEKLNIVSKEIELESKNSNLGSVDKELFLRIEERKKIQEEKDEVSKRIEEKDKLQQEIEKTKIIISNKNESIINNKKTIEQLQFQIKELQDLQFDNSQILQLERKIVAMRKEKEELNEENLKIASQIASLKMKNQDNENIKDKITHIEVCPTCLQDVDSVYKANVVNKIDSDNNQNIKEIDSYELERQKILQEIGNADAQIISTERQIQEFNLIKIKLQGINEKQTRLDEIEKTSALLMQDVGLLTKHLETLQTSVFDLNKFSNIFEEKQRKFEDALKQERLAEIKVAELKREIEVFSRQIQELKEKIAQTEEIKKQLDYLTNLENWLSKQFIPLITYIEKNVMIKLKVEFSKLFAEWFAMLVSDSFNVRLSDDFTPIVEQQDYEIDYAYLSGGERTAIALAYRLALNQTINSLMSKIKTRDLVILDEPTDGFSEQQLDKMRDVLQQLDIKQLIIVSHEQKMESFVENVIKFKKENNVSKSEE